MKRTRYACALLVLTVLSPGCTLFEDIGSDPHPPSVEIAGLIHYVDPAPPTTTTLKPAGLTSHAQSVVWNSGGFALRSGDKFQINVRYADAGGDIVKFRLQDLDGPLKMELLPNLKTYYSGTSGTVILPEAETPETAVGIEFTGVAGPHRIQLWAEDSHLSRSEKVEFVITRIL